jgi:hypothetical protein
MSQNCLNDIAILHIHWNDNVDIQKIHYSFNTFIQFVKIYFFYKLMYYYYYYVL